MLVREQARVERQVARAGCCVMGRCSCIKTTRETAGTKEP